MSIALANSCGFPPAISAAAAVSVSSSRLLSAAPFGCFASNQERNPSIQIEGVSQKKSPWTSVKHKPFGAQRKEKKKSFQFDLKDQDGAANLQNAAYLNAVVKVYCTHTEPDYSLPWQNQRPYTGTSSAFMIGDGKLLTNAHCVEHSTQVKVKRRGDDTKYVAKVLARGDDCDIALLTVESEEFWEDTEPLEFGRLPHLQDSVTVVGYPFGGDTISVTKGVVSRIEVTSYGSSELLAIQIDAAINPGNSGGPAFNDHGECIGIAFQVYRAEEAENIGYVIPTMVVSHFLSDYERNQKYTGFPSLGVLLQKLENPALRECLKVPSTEGVLVRRIEPTADAKRVLKEGDVIVSFDNIRVGCEGTVPFRSNERIAFRYLISQKSAFLLDNCWYGVYTSHRTTYRLKLLTKARCLLAKFKEEQIVILSQVLANDVNIGYEDMSNQQVLKFNGTRIRNIHHLAHLIDSSTGKYLVFEFEDSYMVVLGKKPSRRASSKILRDYGIPSERSDDLLEPYDDSNVETNQLVANGDSGDCPVSNMEIEVDGMLWV
ncbi:Protease Do-like 2, chloroplastic [Linum perenne]